MDKTTEITLRFQNNFFIIIIIIIIALSPVVKLEF